jgi:hypothetical protein
VTKSIAILPNVRIVHTAAFVGGEQVTTCCSSTRTSLISFRSTKLPLRYEHEHEHL